MRTPSADLDAPAAATSMGRALSDRLLGPGATAGEIAMALGAAATAAVLSPMVAAWSGAEWTTLQRLLAALVGADLVGGVVVNASAPARGYYFRPGRREAHHLGFVAIHGVHVALFGAFFAAGGATTAGVLWAGLLLGAMLIRAAPVHLRRAAAMLCLLTGIVAWQALGSAPGAEWFVPALLLKLLVCYLLGDVPSTARPVSLVRAEPQCGSAAQHPVGSSAGGIPPDSTLHLRGPRNWINFSQLKRIQLFRVPVQLRPALPKGRAITPCLRDSMRKLKLNVDELTIQSFPTTPGMESTRGTVRGNSGCCYTDPGMCTQYWSTCDGESDIHCDTEYYCPVTGMESCGCSNEPETCGAPCAVSDMTDCHRC